jgi:Protein of unknown function (DUF4058)
MPCPFPGMDPFLEMQPFWSDFAPKFLTAISNHLLARLLPRYDVRIEEYLMLTEEDRNLHRVRPDGTISQTAAWQPSSGGGVAVLEPVGTELEYPDYEPRTERHLKIIHRPTERVVTVLELLSPANKAPGEDGLKAYLRKRTELLACRCHLVELDLLRGGERLPMSGPLPPGDYYAFIGRVGRTPRCSVLGWPFRSALPTIAIPLLPDDPELPLDLQAVFHAAYEPALYDRRLPYDQPLDPPLRPLDEEWMRESLGSVR